MSKSIPAALAGLAATMCLVGLLPAAQAETSAPPPAPDVALAHVYFTPGDGYLTSDTRLALDQIVETVKRQPEVNRIEVQGHADERGKPGINLEMSQLRARRVAAYLVKHGIDPSLVVMRAYGKGRPMVTNATTDEQHQQNRRVAIRIWGRF